MPLEYCGYVMDAALDIENILYDQDEQYVAEIVQDFSDVTACFV